MSTILVVGATGVLGSEICRRLTAAGRSVRGLVRETTDPAKVSKLQSLGVETVQGDVRDRASLDRACQGVTAVVSTVSSMPFSYQAGVNDIQTTDLDGITNLIEAAKANQVSHFTFISFTGNPGIDFPLQSAKRIVEQRLKDSGLTYTILRPSFFMEVWLSPAVGFDAANAKTVIYGSGQAVISWISVKDVAQFAAASLDHPAAKNVTIDLGGPVAISPLDVVRLFELTNDCSFEKQMVPEDALQAQHQAATEPMQQSFSALMRCYALGDPVDMTGTHETFAVQPTTVQEYARGALSAA
jgi:uncharacterized protein YbjT (DUF2867 family)